MRFIISIIFIGYFFSSTFSQDVEVRSLPVNHKFSNEIAPCFHDSTLYFISNRKSSVVKSVVDNNNEYLYKIYETRLKPDGSWSHVKLAVPRLQSPINNGGIFISENGDQLFITKSQSDNLGKLKKGKTDKFGVFSSEMENGSWTKAKSLNFNSSSTYSVGQPALSEDGELLFFSSDMNKGYGQADIYMCKKVNGEWSEPENLGRKINTPGNELFPFIHPSGKLYFASDGLGGMGGLDIYYSVKVGDSWTDPISVGEPINSEFDDYGCYIMPDANSGYFTSNRDQSENIYFFEMMFPSFDVCKPQKEDKFCFVLFENGPYKSDTLPFIYRWDFGDGQFGKGLKVRHCFPGPGHYSVKLNVVDTLLNVEMMTVAQHEIDLKKREQVFISCPDTVKVGDVISLNANQSHFESITPKEYYWIFDDGKKEKGVTITHIFRKRGIQSITCGTIDVNSDNKFCSTREIIVIE